MADVEQVNFNNEEFIEEVKMSAFTTVTVKISTTKTKKANCWGKDRGEMKFILSAGEA